MTTGFVLKLEKNDLLLPHGLSLYSGSWRKLGNPPGIVVRRTWIGEGKVLGRE